MRKVMTVQESSGARGEDTRQCKGTRWMGIALLMLAFVGVCCLTACQAQAELPTAPSDQEERLEGSASATRSTSSSSATDATTQSIALESVVYVTSYGDTNANSFNQSLWQGVQSFSTSSNVPCSFSAPAEDTDEARLATMTQAVNDGASVIVCSGSDYGSLIPTLVSEHPQTRFLLVGTGMTDTNGKEVTAGNVAVVECHEEQAGYLAGYALVAAGYYDIGFAGGRAVPSVIRYGYGFLQGANAAASELNVADQLYVTYWYADTFVASQAVYDEVAHWYQTGTRAVFSCGGGIVSSVIDAAATVDGGKVVGVDSDQAALSDVVLTSATLNLPQVISGALGKLSDNKGAWPVDMAGKTTTYGAAEDAVALATGTWRLDSWSVDAYQALYNRLKSGEIQVSNSIAERPNVNIQVRWKNEAL